MKKLYRRSGTLGEKEELNKEYSEKIKMIAKDVKKNSSSLGPEEAARKVQKRLEKERR